ARWVGRAGAGARGDLSRQPGRLVERGDEMNRWKPWALALCLALVGCGAADLGPDQHGAVVTPQSLQGQWLVINYWAEWCAPCRKEIPELNALPEHIDGVRVLGVNFDGLR